MRVFLVITTFFLTVAALLAINCSYLPNKSSAQRSFESWLSKLETHSLEYLKLHNLKGKEALKDPVADVEVDFVSTDVPIKWSVKGLEKTSGNSEASQTTSSRILRLLSLIRESNLFSSEKSEIDKDTPQIELLVKQGENHFEVSFTPESIEHNNPAKLLVKLLQVYHQEELALKNNKIEDKEVHRE